MHVYIINGMLGASVPVGLVQDFGYLSVVVVANDLSEPDGTTAGVDSL